MKKRNLILLTFFALLCVFILLDKASYKSNCDLLDDAMAEYNASPITTIVDSDGTVYQFRAMGPTCNMVPMGNIQGSWDTKWMHALSNARAEYGNLYGGQTYYVHITTPKTSTPSTISVPKTETKKEEPKCEHEYSAEVTTESTCKDKGVKTFTCTKCGDTYTEEIDVVNIHTFNESKEEVIKEATCTESGEVKRTCSICGYEETSPIPMLVHDYKEKITKEATCTEKGVKTFTCELCSDSYTEDIDELGHTEGQFEVTKPNGLFSDGEQIKKCTVCNEVLATEVIPAKYPIWYLYCGIGVIAAIIIAVAAVAIAKKKKTK